MSQVLRKAQGICLELPGVQLGNGNSTSLGSEKVENAEKCVEKCRGLVDCGQAIFSSGNSHCYFFKGSSPVVAAVDKMFHSCYCGMLKNLKELKVMQQELLTAIKERKVQGVCNEIANVQLRGVVSLGPISDEEAPNSTRCFDLCRTHPNCDQATFSKGGSCRFFQGSTSEVEHVGDSYRSAYCGGAKQFAHMTSLKKKVTTAKTMRKAQGICSEMHGIQLSDGSEKSLAWRELNTSKKCFDQCRIEPACGQAVFLEENSSCFVYRDPMPRAALVGDAYHSAFCGELASAQKMKTMKSKIHKALEERKAKAVCLEVEGVQLKGRWPTVLASPRNMNSSLRCFDMCRVVPDCKQATFGMASGACYLHTEASSEARHVGSAYRSAYCGDPAQADKMKKDKDKVTTKVGSRKGIGLCKEVPGVRLADPKHSSGSLAQFTGDTNVTAKKCIDRCRVEPGCEQAVYSEGNNGCYVFKDRSPVASYANSIYHSAFCGTVMDEGKMTKLQKGIDKQAKMRKATGICVEIKDVKLADSEGVKEVIPKEEAGTYSKCFDRCRQRLGCQQAVFSFDNDACYIFEGASRRAAYGGSMYRSAYCSDLEHAKRMGALKAAVSEQVDQRQDNGVCFELPSVRLADGKGSRLAKLPGNASRSKCVEACRAILGCQQAVFADATGDCYTFEEHNVAVFSGLYDNSKFHSTFCGDVANWKRVKSLQVKVQKMFEERKVHGACIDLPGVLLANGTGETVEIWANSSTQCVQSCRQKMFCGQAIYHNTSCRLFENPVVDFAALGKKFHSARCAGWKNFKHLEQMQNQTLAKMHAVISKQRAATKAAAAAPPPPPLA